MIRSRELLDVVSGLLTQESYDQALSVLNKLEPSATVNWLMGQAWFGKGNLSRAIALLREALITLIDPQQILECTIDLSRALTRSGKWREALELLSSIADKIEGSDDQRLHILHQIAIGRTHLRGGNANAYLKIWQTVESQLLSLGLQHEWITGMTSASIACIVSNDWPRASALIDHCLGEIESGKYARSVALLTYEKVICSYCASGAMTSEQIDHLFVTVNQADASDIFADALCAKGIHLWTQGNWPEARLAFHDAYTHYVELGIFLDADLACISLARIALDQADFATSLDWTKRVPSEMGAVDSSHWVMGWVSLIEGWIHESLGNTKHAQALLESGWFHFMKIPWDELAIFCALQLAILPSLSLVEKQIWIERATDRVNKIPSAVYPTMVNRVRGEHLLAIGDAAAARIALAQVLSTSETAGLHPEWVRAAAGLIECDLALAHTPADWAAVDERAATYLAACAGFPEIQARIAFVRAEAAHASGNAPAALAHLHTASQHIRWMRSLAGDPALSGAIAGNFEPIYQRGAAIAIGVGDLPLAVEFAESRRAQHLAQRTALHPTPLQPKPDPALPIDDPSTASPHQNYTHFAERRRSLQSALNGVLFSDKPNAAEQTAKLNQALEQQRQAYDELNAQAMARTARERTGPVDVLDVPGLRAAFNQRFGPAWTAVQIEPAAGKPGAEETAPAHSGDAWWLMVLTPDDLSIELIQLKTPIDRQSVQWLTNTTLSWRMMMLAGQDKDAVFRRASALLQVEHWLANAVSPEHTLIFAGCEPFTHLPLPALLCADGRRLSERVILRHAPSWNVAAHLCARRPQHSPDRLKALLIAPVSFGGRYPDLPASLMEIEALKALWPDSDTLLGAEASVEALNTLNQNQALKSYDVVHFATHVEFDAEWSRISGIALHDSDLWLQDLLDWELEAGLVCVSGCEAGRGSPVGGEESLGIEAAFIAAGARNVLSPEWHVRDNFAGEFISAVMQALQHTDDVGLALARAQRTFARTHSMLDWAAWRVFGMS